MGRVGPLVSVAEEKKPGQKRKQEVAASGGEGAL
jgi:hypothetical protein